MPETRQQQTLSVRIDDAMRGRLERARQLAEVKTGRVVSMSQVANQFLHAAREDRLDIIDLLANPTESLLQVRRKAEAQIAVSRAEWAVLAHFVRYGIETVAEPAHDAASSDSLVAILDAFRAAYDVRPARQSPLDAYYLGNLPPECRPTPSPGTDDVGPVTSDLVLQTVAETRRRVSDPSTRRDSVLVGRNLYVLLAEEPLLGTADLNRALRPFWSTLWRLAARGHYVVSQAPVRQRVPRREEPFHSPIPSITEGPFTLSFSRDEEGGLAALLTFPGPRGAWYPIIGFPRLREFRAMVSALARNGEPTSWQGTYFSARHTTTEVEQARETWFSARDNGIMFRLTLEEWTGMEVLLHRVWERPDIKRAWEALTLEYGEA